MEDCPASTERRRRRSRLLGDICGCWPLLVLGVSESSTGRITTPVRRGEEGVIPESSLSAGVEEEAEEEEDEEAGGGM